MQNYSTLQDTEHDHDHDAEESGVLFHVAEPSRARWNHIDDLDSFFARVYRYHQRHGYLCMLLQELLELSQYVFMVIFTIFLVHCVDYPVLFRDKRPTNHMPNTTDKVSFNDFVLSPKECSANFHMWTYICLVIAIFVWACRLIRGAIHLIHFYDTRLFFNSALGIADSELDNLTWNEVQTRVRAVQTEQQMCIHKRELTELDIYHRILRQHNYLVAMTNKHLVPPRMRVPLMGDIVYWTKGLRYNVQLLLFWGPWAPFENSWHLKEEYKKHTSRHELARQLGQQILWLALANLMLSPLILLWQILYMFFNYAELVKREPGSLGMRNWSLYGRLYLRHFNELDHEMQARLSRAHRPATKYLSSFSSPVAAVIARSVAFLAGAVLAVIISLTLYDEDVFNVEHMLLVVSVLTGIIAVCRALIPDETVSYCPETLLANVVAHTHYLPHDWKSHAHTVRVRTEFQQLFQYKVVAILEEMLSPVITPYVLWRHVYPKALDIVDFYRNFTVSVVGVGDVCSFAQMDVRKHGNPDWHDQNDNKGGIDAGDQVTDVTVEITGQHLAAAPNQYTQAEDGKIELSLVHFTLTNPQWRPPESALQFVRSLERERHSMPQPASMLPFVTSATDIMCDSSINSVRSIYAGHMWRLEGPPDTDPMDMTMSTMCLHDRYHNKQANRYQSHSIESQSQQRHVGTTSAAGPAGSLVAGAPAPGAATAAGAGESTPLLSMTATPRPPSNS